MPARRRFKILGEEYNTRLDEEEAELLLGKSFLAPRKISRRLIPPNQGSDASAFCGSSPGKNPSNQLAAIQLAKQLVERKIDFVYGGTSPISFKTIPFCKPSQSISPIAMELPVVPWLLWPTLTEPRSNGLIYATQCSSPVMGCFI
ncbi:hypothetical protein K1719_045663 [Acacia pycnantha]|nr:hypothetical protein K1719_045663 [Acacia pycnantha]